MYSVTLSELLAHGMATTPKKRSRAKANVRALEFFSGIGGFHVALRSAIPEHSTVLAAFDINTNATAVYNSNFSKVPIVRSDIKRLSCETVENYNANMWLMSPPCQPYSRRGKFLDTKDPRASGFLHLVDVLAEMRRPPTYLLLENVEGFETSDTRKLLVSTAMKRGYAFREFILSPHNFGIPNKRDR